MSGKKNFPKIYNFLLSEEFGESCLSWDLQSFKVQSPSYDVLFEHTIGVIWHLFAHNGRERLALNRVDIAWALKFLEAIDLTNVSDTTDLDALKTYMRNILIVRYTQDKVDDSTGSAVEQSTNSQNENNAFIEDSSFSDSGIGHDSTYLHSYYDYLDCPEFIEDLKKNEEKCKNEILEKSKIVVENKSPCTDEEFLKRLQSLNPLIKTLEDVMKLYQTNE
jgi:hypothetical protein